MSRCRCRRKMKCTVYSYILGSNIVGMLLHFVQLPLHFVKFLLYFVKLLLLLLLAEDARQRCARICDVVEERPIGWKSGWVDGQRVSHRDYRGWETIASCARDSDLWLKAERPGGQANTKLYSQKHYAPPVFSYENLSSDSFKLDRSGEPSFSGTTLQFPIPPRVPTMSSGNTAAPSPVRAITSTLSTRAAPPILPASQTYEPLARAVLRRRLLYDILPLSILPVWTSAICWKMWNSGGMSASGILNALAIPIHPGTFLMTTILWVFGVLPIIVLRKSQLTGESINRDL